MNTYRVYIYKPIGKLEIYRIKRDIAVGIFAFNTLHKEIEPPHGTLYLKDLRTVKEYKKTLAPEGYAEQFEAVDDNEAISKFFVDIL